MKKSDLKQLIKPLVKECIHEVLIEEGLLSNVVAEVAKGMQGNLIVEPRAPRVKQEDRLFNENLQMKHKAKETNTKLEEHRRKMMDSIGSAAYNGVDLFEGTNPIKQSDPKPGATDLGSPNDSGVDISALMGDASKIWQAMK